MHTPPEETDGPPGAIAMAAALQALGKEVAMVVDHRALEMNTRIMEDAVEKGRGSLGNAVRQRGRTWPVQECLRLSVWSGYSLYVVSVWSVCGQYVVCL